MATFTSVQSTNGSFTTSGSITLPTTGAVLGNLLVVCLSEGNSVAITLPPRWLQAGPTESQSGTFLGSLYYLLVGSLDAGATTFAFSTGSGHTVAWTIREWHSSIGWAPAPVDQATGATSASSVTVATGTTGATQLNSELAVASLGWATTGPTESGLTAGWTSGQTGSSGGNSVREAYIFLTSAGTQACQETISTAEANGGVIATFMPEAAGGPIRLPQQLSTYARRLKHSRQVQQFSAQSPSVNINPAAVQAAASFPAISLGYAPYLAAISDPAGPGWFTDQHGTPKLWVATETWGLFVRAGEWNGSNWDLDFDDFFTARAAQGVTVTMTDVMESNNDTFVAPPYANGNTWDNVSPWTNGTDSSGGLNPTFWTRVDYMLSSALRNGITIGFTVCNDTDFGTGGPYASWTTSQMQAYGTAVATRYASQPNIVWLQGNDVIPNNYDTYFSAFVTGLAAAGDTHPISNWFQAEYTSRYNTYPLPGSSVTAGYPSPQFNFVYTYNCGYYGIEFAYNEVVNNSAANLIPVIWGDGYWYAGDATYSANDRAIRQEWWWTLASGARGILCESNNVYQWNSSACLTAVTTDWSFVNTLPAITAYFQSLPEWWNLLPDLTSALVTAGRGTRIAGEVSGGSATGYEPAFTNTWVAASITPDATLAVCYLPVHTVITVDTASLAAGWTAKWVDPLTCATSSAGAGPTFSSTAKGTNSQGDPDWVLVFQAASSTVTLPALVMAPPIPA